MILELDFEHISAMIPATWQHGRSFFEASVWKVSLIVYFRLNNPIQKKCFAEGKSVI